MLVYEMRVDGFRRRESAVDEGERVVLAHPLLPQVATKERVAITRTLPSRAHNAGQLTVPNRISPDGSTRLLKTPNRSP